MGSYLGKAYVTAGGSQTITLPTTAQAGDIAVICFAHGTTFTNTTNPANYTELGYVACGSSSPDYIRVGVIALTAGQTTVTFNTGATYSTSLLMFRGYVYRAGSAKTSSTSTVQAVSGGSSTDCYVVFNERYTSGAPADLVNTGTIGSGATDGFYKLNVASYTSWTYTGSTYLGSVALLLQSTFYAYSTDDSLTVDDQLAKLLPPISTNESSLSLADNISNKFVYGGFGLSFFDSSQFDIIVRSWTQNGDDSTILSDSVSLKPNVKQGNDSLSLVDAYSVIFKQQTSDTLSLLDSIVKYIQDLSNNDSLALADGYNAKAMSVLTDSILLTDGIYSLIQAILAGDSASVADLLAIKTTLGTINDSIDLTGDDSITIEAQPLITDTISMLDGLTTAVTAYKSDLLSIADSYTAYYSSADPETVLSTLDAIALNLSRGANDEALTLAEALAIKTMPAETDELSVPLSDGYTLTPKPSYADSISTIAESIVFSVQTALSDLLNLTDGVKSHFQDNSNIDSMTMADAIGMNVKKSLGDTLLLADAITSYPSLFLPDQAKFGFATFDQTQFDADKGDLTVLSDNLVVNKIISQLLADTMNLVDSLTYYAKTILSDSQTLNDAYSLSPGLVKSESVNLADSNTFNISPMISDALTLTEAVLKNIVTTYSDSTTLTDTIQSFIQTLLGTDNISLSDDYNYVMQYASTLYDTLNLNDSIKSFAMSVLNDLLTLSENIKNSVGSFPGLDSQTVSDLLVTLLTLVRQYDDTMSLLDSLSMSLNKILSESLALNDSYAAQVNSSKAEVLSIIEALGLDVSKPLPSDLVGVLDESQIRAMLGLPSEYTGLTDSIEGRKFVMLQQVFIEGVQVPVTGLKITHSVQDRVSSCTFTIHAPSQQVLQTATHRAEVKAYLVDGEGKTDYFGGRIVQNPVSGRTAVSSQLEITADDWTALSQDILVTEVFSSDDGTLTDLLKYMWTKYYPQSISFEGVVSTEKTLDKYVFNYQSLFDCTETICQLLGWVWYVDWNGAERVLQFFPPSSSIQPVTLSDVNRNIVSGTAKFGQNEKMCNSVFVFGGTGLSDPFTENVVADGATRGYSIGSRPASIDKTKPISVKVNGGSPLTWGYANINNAADYDVLMDFDNKVILWRDDNKPKQGDIISRTYQFTYPILVHLTDDVSIKKYGLVEQTIQDGTIATVQNAREVGKAYLRDNSLPQGYGSCEVFVEGLRAGQFITVNMPKYNVNGLYEIVEIEKWIDGSRVRRSVTLNVSDNPEARIAKRLKDFASRLSSLESGQRPEDMTVQRIIRSAKNLGVSIEGLIDGRIYYNQGDNPILDEYYTIMLHTTGAYKGQTSSRSIISDYTTLTPKPNKSDLITLSNYVKVGTALVDKTAKFGISIFGAEVAS